MLTKISEHLYIDLSEIIWFDDSKDNIAPSVSTYRLKSMPKDLFHCLNKEESDALKLAIDKYMKMVAIF